MAANNPVNSRITGMRMSVDATGLIVSVGPGQCFLPNTQRIATDADLTVSAGTPAASSWVHVYAYLSSPTTPAIEVVATAPSAPYQGTARTKTGDTSRRFIGSLWVGSDGKIIPIRHGNPGQNANRVEFMGTNGLANTAYVLILNGVNQTATVVSAAAMVPPVSTFLVMQVDNSATLPLYLSNPDLGTVSATNFLRSVKAGGGGQMDIILNASQQFSYVFGAGLIGLGTINIRGIAYFYDR